MERTNTHTVAGQRSGWCLVTPTESQMNTHTHTERLELICFSCVHFLFQHVIFPVKNKPEKIYFLVLKINQLCRK